MTDELKPCPLCGDAAELDTGRQYRSVCTGNLEIEVAIYCRNCTVELALCQGDVPELSIDDIAQYLTGLWNRRAAIGKLPS